MAAEPKTYTVGFQVRNLGVFQDRENKLFGDAALNTAVLERFKETLTKRLPGGTLSEDLKTFTTAAPVKLLAGYYSSPLMIFPATLSNKDNRKKLLDSIPVEQDPEDLGIGNILLFPTAIKGGKSRRSTRRKRTTRRR
jgi:hypothetical protein